MHRPAASLPLGDEDAWVFPAIEFEPCGHVLVGRTIREELGAVKEEWVASARDLRDEEQHAVDEASWERGFDVAPDQRVSELVAIVLVEQDGPSAKGRPDSGVHAALLADGREGRRRPGWDLGDGCL